MALQTFCKYGESYFYSLNSIIIAANCNINHIEKYGEALFKVKLYLEKLKGKLGKIQTSSKRVKRSSNCALA